MAETETKTREEAMKTLSPFITKRGYYRVVADGDARRLLGDHRFACMRSDRLRNLRPEAGWNYYWNVLDYLMRPATPDGDTP